jgi:hypothetical protein
MYDDDDSDYKNGIDDDEEEDEDGTSTDAVWRQNRILRERCKEYKLRITKLTTELRLSKSHERQTKCQIRIDYEWDGEDANLADLVSHWVKTYLFPRYKFLKAGWMTYSKSSESLSLFVRKKMRLAEGVDYREQWERVICPTIQMKYVSIRCNLNNKVRKAYKSK